MAKTTRTPKSTKTTQARSTVSPSPWRTAMGRALALGQGAVGVVQSRGAQAVAVARRRGESLTLKARQAAEQRLEGVADKVIGTWGTVESVASERVGRTLNRLGVPSQKDIERLTRSVAKLSSQIEKLSAAAPAAAPTAAAKPARSVRSSSRSSTTGASPAARRSRAAAPVATEASAS